MIKMSRSRKKTACCHKDLAIIDPINTSRNKSCVKGAFLFPTNIKKLLILIAENDDENRADIILDACSGHCFIQNARVIAVLDDTVVIKDDCKFRFVSIDCICEVIVDCETILEELFEEHSINRG